MRQAEYSRRWRRLRLAAGITALTVVVVPAVSGQVLFSDVSDSVGVAFKHDVQVGPLSMAFGTGASWFDFDRDGDPDLFVTQSIGPNRLFINDGQGQFEEAPGALGAADSTGYGGGVAAADYDNDGWIDLYLANNISDVLLKNVDGERFEDVTVAAGFSPDEFGRGTSAAWGDYDRDGFVDLVVTNHFSYGGPTADHRARVYHNNGDGTFSDMSSSFLDSDLAGYGFAASWTDHDNDGEIDLFVVNDCKFFSPNEEPPKLLRNLGADSGVPRFEDVLPAPKDQWCRNGMGIAVADYDRNGWLDYFQSDIGQTLLLANRGGELTDETVDAGVGIAPFRSLDVWTWGTDFFDYDLDGWPDLFVAAGDVVSTVHPQYRPMDNYLFHNRGDGTFEDVSTTSGIWDDGPTRTSAVADYDGDGDLDLYIVSSGTQGRLFRNDSSSDNNFLAIETVGQASNREGIGARIEVELADGSVLIDEVRSGSSLGAGSRVPVHFGLGREAALVRVTVRWPSGVVQTIPDVDANQVLVVREAASGTAVQTEQPTADGRLEPPFPNPFRATVSIRVLSERPGRITIHDITGRVVRRLAAPAGASVVTWDGLTAEGHLSAPGLYVASFEGNLMPARTIHFLGR